MSLAGFQLKARVNESNMLVQHFLNVGPTCWIRLRQCVQHVGPIFRKRSDIVMTSLIACNCVAFESFFSVEIMADKQMFKALVMVELLDSEEEEETKGRRMTRSLFIIIIIIVIIIINIIYRRKKS